MARIVEQAAGSERHHLRAEDREGRSADRLEAQRARARLADPRPVAVAGRLVRGQRRTHQGAAGRTGCGLGRAGRSAVASRRRVLRPRAEARDRAARRPRADGCRRVPARLRASDGRTARLMPRYRIVIEYDGGPFAGWQRQENGPSVQGALEDAVFKLSQERVTLSGAGRTDAGVHARGQVAHFDLVKDFPPDTVRDALNAHLRPASGCGAGSVGCGGRFPRALLGRRASLRIPHSLPPRAAGAGSRPCLACRTQAGCERDGARRLSDARHARFHHVPFVGMPGEVAGEDARPVRCLRAGRRDRVLRLRPLVPASSGALDGRHAEAGGRGQVDRCRRRAGTGGARSHALRPVAPPDGLTLLRVDY